MDPCENATFSLQLVIAILAAFNTGLATFLANRRVKADRERRNGHSNGNAQSGSHLTQQRINGGDTGGPRE